jgi:hypothetical protein
MSNTVLYIKKCLARLERRRHDDDTAAEIKLAYRDLERLNKIEEAVDEYVELKDRLDAQDDDTDEQERIDEGSMDSAYEAVRSALKPE